MRNLYIHIGQPKTGSSAIQRFLVDNRETLLEAGLGLGPYMTLATGKSLPLRRAIAHHGLAHVMAELAASPGEHLVISSEHLCSIFGDARQAEAIRDAARPHFNPVIVVSLRRQDYWHESLYAQQVKTVFAGPIEDYTVMTLAAGPSEYEYDYDRGIAGLERVFGQENVRLLLYRDQGPNDLIGGFLAALDLDVDPGRLKSSGRQNSSPHRRKVLFLGQVPKPDPAIQDLAAHMTGVVEKTEAIADDCGRFLLPPLRRHALVAAQAAGNQALVDRYGLADAGEFACPPDPEADWSPPPPIEVRERRAVLGEALAACVRVRHPRFTLRMTSKVASLYVTMH